MKTFDRLAIFIEEQPAGWKPRHAALICLEIATLLREKLDNEQIQAISTARSFWCGNGSKEDRDLFLEKMWKRQDRIMAGGKDYTYEGALNRIVTCSLVYSTALSPALCELLDELCTTLALGDSEITPIVRTVIPGFG